MTAKELLRLVLRRWYLMLAGAALTLCVLYVAIHQQGVYWTQFTLVLLSPTGRYYPNKIEDPRYSMSPMAGLLVADWNGSRRPLLTASGDTTLYGEGLRQGVEVRLPNQGSQWQPLYVSPNVDVQVVGADVETVEREAARVTSELSALLDQRQEAAGIRPSMRMTLISSPKEPSVAYVSGSRPRAMLAIGLAGAIVTTSLVCAVDWYSRRPSTDGRSRSGQKQVAVADLQNT